MKAQFIPNIITILRFFLIIPIVITLLAKKYEIAFSFFIIAGLSDGLDGFLARRYHWTSHFGAMADPIADKLLMLATYACLTWLGKIPVWLFLIVIGRDLWLVIGVIAYRYFVAALSFKPSRISKINTCCQLLLVVVILFNEVILKLADTFIETIIYVVLITTLSSLVDYTWVWGKRALKSLRFRSL
jgi:cardiolipin synthase